MARHRRGSGLLTAGAGETPADRIGGAVDAFIAEIARGEVLTAEKADPNAPKIVTHRGMEIV